MDKTFQTLLFNIYHETYQGNLPLRNQKIKLIFYHETRRLS